MGTPFVKRIGYIRVSSSIDQNTVRQLDGVAVDRIFADKASGKNTDRPQLKAALSYAILLGSGASRAADIRTGWETTMDLVLNVAPLEQEIRSAFAPQTTAERFFEIDQLSVLIGLTRA